MGVFQNVVFETVSKDFRDFRRLSVVICELRDEKLIEYNNFKY
jgi:hypothetical protein